MHLASGFPKTQYATVKQGDVKPDLKIVQTW